MLANSAILVRTTFRALNTNLSDRVQQANVEASTGAKHGKVSVKKQILSEWPALRKRKTIKQNAYTRHIDMTSPTFNDGERLLNAVKAFDYGDEIKKARDELALNAQEIRDTYEQAVEHDKAVLGTMSENLRYPSADEIVGAFEIDSVFLPVPTNFLVPMPQHEIDKMEAKMKELESIVNDDILEQIKGLASGFATALKEAQRFHADSWVDKVNDLTSRVGYLNVYDNETIKQVNAALHDLVAEVRADELRVSPEAKQNLAADLESFIKDYEGMF